MLDVNVGDPLADEVELMRKAVPRVQELTDLPLCIDSSVIEALEAGLSVYEGKALVNSVTGEDERLELILPIVARYGAAVIGLANDGRDPDGARAAARDRAQDRLGRRRLRDPARGHRDRRAGDADRRRPRAVVLFFETLRLIREELGVNTTCGASNTRFGMPGRHALNARVPGDRLERTA